MVRVGLYARLEAKAGKKGEVAEFLAAALMAKASELLSEPPNIQKLDVLAAKLNG